MDTGTYGLRESDGQEGGIDGDKAEIAATPVRVGRLTPDSDDITVVSEAKTRASAQEDEAHTLSDLTSYINRLTRTSLLSASEESRLAVRVRDGDQAAKMKMIEANMRLVVSIAKTYLSSGIPLEDLIQEGSIGLMTASERFDPDRGYRFSTYATQWIRQAIGRAVDNKAKSIRLPAHVSESLRKVEKARVELKRRNGTDPTSEQIAQMAGISIKKMNNLLQTTQEPISLDTPVGDEENTPLGNLLFDKASPDPQESLINTEMRDEIEAILDSLDEREQLIMRCRFGFEDDDRRVLQVIGEKLGISRERVRQLEAQAIRKLRAAARKKRLREYLQR
ncbi:MAG TPA: RNA polymerase sigma factor RpoD/SigA [Capsulimonadaceae bacterium]|jgi:RNA polymerase primary sigma factor